LPGGPGPVVFAPISVDRFFLQGDPMADFESKWMAFYAEKVEPFYKEMVSHIEKLIIGTLIVSAGAHVSSDEPSIQLFGYLRHSLVGRGVMLIGVIILDIGAEFHRRALQAREGKPAFGVADRDVVFLHRGVGSPDPAHPRLSRRRLAGSRL
jgi:hypothetical protein